MSNHGFKGQDICMRILSSKYYSIYSCKSYSLIPNVCPYISYVFKIPLTKEQLLYNNLVCLSVASAYFWYFSLNICSSVCQVVLAHVRIYPYHIAVTLQNFFVIFLLAEKYFQFHVFLI